MGAPFYRRAGRRNTTTDAKFAFEADISSWGRQFNAPRVSRAGCACPAKQHKRPSRGTLATIGLLQNWHIRRGPGPERVRGSWECRAEREKRRRAADMVNAGAGDAARAGPHLVGSTSDQRGGTDIRNQPRSGHPVAASIFTLRAIPDLYDHGLTTDSLCGTFQQTFLRLCTHALLFLFFYKDGDSGRRDWGRRRRVEIVYCI